MSSEQNNQQASNINLPHPQAPTTAHSQGTTERNTQHGQRYAPYAHPRPANAGASGVNSTREMPYQQRYEIMSRYFRGTAHIIGAALAAASPTTFASQGGLGNNRLTYRITPEVLALTAQVLTSRDPSRRAQQHEQTANSAQQSSMATEQPSMPPAQTLMPIERLPLPPVVPSTPRPQPSTAPPDGPKARNACQICRNQHRRCDRLLPSCSRCQKRNRECTYRY